jgi:succinyl-diaminopimelate desuccinylase
MPHLGINAAFKAVRVLTALETFQFNVAPHTYLGSRSLNVCTVHAGLNVNSVPDLAEIGIDIRSIPGLDHSRIQEHLKGIPRPRASRRYMGSSATSPGKDAGSEPRTDPCFTEASALTPAFGNPPTIILGPGEAAKAHQTEEYCNALERRRISIQGLLQDGPEAPNSPDFGRSTAAFPAEPWHRRGRQRWIPQ